MQPAFGPSPCLLLINGNSRKGRAAFHQAVAALAQAKVPIREAKLAGSPEESIALLKKEVASGAACVIVGGGDGTLSHCAEVLANTPVTMAVLPLGTGNTFVRSLGLPVTIPGAVQAIVNGKVVSIDVGQVNDQIFLNSVAVGLSTKIAQALSKEVKAKLGLFSWPYVGARMLLTHRAVRVRITTDERSFVVRTHQLVIANGRYVAGPILASQDASVMDSHLTVFVLGGAGKGLLLRAALEWITHRHTDWSRQRYFEAKTLTVESLRRPLKANVDGEINEWLPLHLKVLPRALKVIVPQGFVADEA